jgi:hypothetical protein
MLKPQQRARKRIAAASSGHSVTTTRIPVVGFVNEPGNENPIVLARVPDLRKETDCEKSCQESSRSGDLFNSHDPFARENEINNCDEN